MTGARPWMVVMVGSMAWRGSECGLLAVVVRGTRGLHEELVQGVLRIYALPLTTVGAYSPFPPLFSTDPVFVVLIFQSFCSVRLTIYHGPDDYCNELQTYF